MGKTDTTLEHSVNVSQNLSKGDWEHVGLWETGVKKQTAVGAWEVRRKGGMPALEEKDAPAPREGRKRQKLQVSQSPTRICGPRGLCSPVRKEYWRRSCLRKSWYLALPSLHTAKSIFPNICLSRVDIYCNTVLVSTVLGNRRMPF